METKRCNCCGKNISSENGIFKEDMLEIEKDWGYFSDKDGQKHKIIICEICYDKWVSGFLLPPAAEERTELV